MLRRLCVLTITYSVWQSFIWQVGQEICKYVVEKYVAILSLWAYYKWNRWHSHLKQFNEMDDGLLFRFNHRFGATPWLKRPSWLVTDCYLKSSNHTWVWTNVQLLFHFNTFRYCSASLAYQCIQVCTYNKCLYIHIYIYIYVCVCVF